MMKLGQASNRFVIAGLSVLTVITACAPAARTSAAATITSARDIEAIMEQSRRLSAAYIKGDIAELVSVYKPDGIAAPGGRDFIKGRDALLAYWSLPEGRTVLRHRSTPTEIKVDGDHAYDWGYYEGQGAQNGVPLTPFRGAYVIVWERSSDGKWLIAMDIWHSLPQGN